MSMSSPTEIPRITRFPEQPERCGIHLLQRLSQTTPGRGISADSRGRHRYNRVLLSLNPVLRDKVLELLERAHDMHAIIYYDPNFRSSHKEEAIKLAPTIIENLEYANIVRGSQEDFFYMWGLQEADKIYKDKVKFYCRNFLCTAGAEQVSLRTGTISKEYSIPPLEAVSTIGAGDNFNAGIIFGLLKYNVRYEDLDTMDEATWDKIIQCGIEFAAEVCKSFNNSVSKEFAEARKYQP